MPIMKSVTKFMILRLLPLVIVLFLSCKKNEIENQSSCLLEKSTQENGDKLSEVQYDSQQRLISVEYIVKDLNFSVSYDDAKNIKLIKSRLFGQIEVLYNSESQIIEANTPNGKLSFTYSGKNISKITHEAPASYTPVVNGVSKITDYRFEYTCENVSKVFLTNGTRIKDLLIFEATQYDDKNSIFPQIMKEYLVISRILNYFVSNYDLDFSYLSKNNIMVMKYYQPYKADFIRFQYSYTYNSEGYPVQAQYSSNNGKIFTNNYSYICR